MEPQEELDPSKPYISPGIPALPYRSLEEEAELPRIRCLCGRPQSERYHEFRILSQSKRPNEPLNDVFETMGLNCTRCRDYFLNLTRVVNGTWNSGNLTKKGDKWVKAEPELPASIPKSQRNYVVYDRWNRTPLGNNDIKPKRRYELTQQKSSPLSISDLFAIYEALAVQTFLLAELWIEATYPKMETDDVDGKIAFLLKFGSFDTLIQGPKRKMIDILEEPDLEVMLDEVFSSNSLTNQTNTQANFCIHIKARKVSVPVLVYPRSDETILLIYTEGKIIPKRTHFYLSEILTRLFDNNPEAKSLFNIDPEDELKKLEVRFRNDFSHLPGIETYRGLLQETYSKFQSLEMNKEKKKDILARLTQLNNDMRLVATASRARQQALNELETEGFIS